jgi:opacity protein-like surface antigen
MRRFGLFLLALISLTLTAFAQTQPENPNYSRRNTFGVFTAYSNDSSHILMGVEENRKLLSFGVSYGRRLLQNRIVNWQYNGELLPVSLESDPTDHYTFTETSPNQYTLSTTSEVFRTCHSDSGSGSETINGTVVTYTYSNVCSRRWTIGEAISPIGFQWNFMPRHKLQPFFIAHGGYMYSTQPIPESNAGSFNFTFDFGAGLELYRTKTRSIRAEYRYHHISNHDTATENPGIDNGLFQVTYAFGR